MRFQRRSEDRQGHNSVIQRDLCQPRHDGGDEAGERGAGGTAGRGQDCSTGSHISQELRPPRLSICCKTTLSLHPAFAARRVPSGDPT